MRVTQQVNELASRLRRHPSTIFSWLARGLDIDSETSIQEFLQGKKTQAELAPLHNCGTESPTPAARGRG
jgi:hypothetical protein